VIRDARRAAPAAPASPESAPRSELSGRGVSRFAFGHRDGAGRAAIIPEPGLREDRNVDCGSKIVHKEDGMGNSTTVRKEGC
jgi:hypothetical protein